MFSGCPSPPPPSPRMMRRRMATATSTLPATEKPMIFAQVQNLPGGYSDEGGSDDTGIAGEETDRGPAGTGGGRLAARAAKRPLIWLAGTQFGIPCFHTMSD